MDVDSALKILKSEIEKLPCTLILPKSYPFPQINFESPRMSTGIDACHVYRSPI